MKDEITLKHTGYYITGIAGVEFWNGEVGTVNMDDFKLKELTEENLIKGINDGQFGCKKIVTARCNIYKTFGQGYNILIGEAKFRDGKMIWTNIEEKEWKK